MIIPAVTDEHCLHTSEGNRRKHPGCLKHKQQQHVNNNNYACHRPTPHVTWQTHNFSVMTRQFGLITARHTHTPTHTTSLGATAVVCRAVLWVCSFVFPAVNLRVGAWNECTSQRCKGLSSAWHYCDKTTHSVACLHTDSLMQSNRKIKKIMRCRDEQDTSYKINITVGGSSEWIRALHATVSVRLLCLRQYPVTLWRKWILSQNIPEGNFVFRCFLVSMTKFRSGQSDQAFCVFGEPATDHVICTGMYSMSSGLAVWSVQTYADLITFLSLAKVRFHIDQLWSREKVKWCLLTYNVT